MKFAKLASLFVFITLSVLAIGVASAQSTVLAFTPSSIAQSIQAGQSSTINFNLTYTGQSSTPVTLTWTTSGVPITINAAPISISQGQTIPVSAVINVPSTASGTINAVINVTPSTSQTPASLPITITVTNPSSTITLTPPSSAVNVNQNATFTISNTGTSTFSTISLSETSTPAFGVIFTPLSISNLAPGSSNAQTFTARVPSSSNALKFGFNQVNIQASSGSQVATSSFQVKKTFCSSGEILTGNLTIDEVSWENNGEGDDDSWELLDEIEVQVKVQNNNNDDDVDVIVELGVFDSSGNNVADDLVFLEDSDSSDEEIEVNIDDDSDEEVQWVFKVPADFDAGSYKLAVKAYNDDDGESSDCRDSTSEFNNGFFQTVQVEEASDEGRFVVVDEIDMDSQAVCGETVSGEFTVFNIGEDDQDRVRILIRNKELGVEFTREITSDLDQGDEESLTFSFQVPATARNGNYVLEFITEYDYKNGVYREESEDSFDHSFEVIGCTQNIGTGNSGGLTNIQIDAELLSEAKAGDELVIVATISNTGTEDAEYSISARGYSSWAELLDISPGTVSVDAGDSEEVTLTLLVNEDVSEMQSFELQVSKDGRVQIQEIEVEFESASGQSLFSSGSSLIWIIGAINLLLIILIVVVAVKMSRR